MRAPTEDVARASGGENVSDSRRERRSGRSGRSASPRGDTGDTERRLGVSGAGRYGAFPDRRAREESNDVTAVRSSGTAVGVPRSNRKSYVSSVANGARGASAVSYTHLTLPTIYSV